MGCVNQMKGKSSTTVKKNVDIKIKKKSFKNRIKGFAKKFAELGTLCDVKSAGVCYSEFIKGGVVEFAKDWGEFNEVMRMYEQYKIHGKGKKRGEDQRLCPNFDNLSVQSLEDIERDLESKLGLIAEQGNRLNGSSVPSSSNCNLDEKMMNLGVIDESNWSSKMNFGVIDESASSGSGFGCSSSSDTMFTLPPSNSNQDESGLLVVGSSSEIAVYDSGCSSSSALITLPPPPSTAAATDSFADMFELEFGRLNCSSYSEMMNMSSSIIDQPQFLLC